MGHVITDDDVAWVRNLARIVRRKRNLWAANEDDMAGDGMLGLMSAADRYDPDHPACATFRTYAHDRVVGAMIDGHRSWYTRSQYRPKIESLEGRRVWVANRLDRGEPVDLATALPPGAFRHIDLCDNHDNFEFDVTMDGRLDDTGDRKLVAFLAVDDMDKHEVATLFGVTPGAISHRLKKIRRQLGVRFS